MTTTVSAVYENAVLRPSEPLPLNEHQKVNVTVSDMQDRAEAWLDHGYMAAIDAMDESAPTLDGVRRILSKTSGSLSDAVRAERDARGWHLGIYLDTSALAKLYRPEIGTAIVERMINEASGECYISRLGVVATR